MEENLHIMEKFDAYLKGSMTASEKTQMEKELEENPEMREELRLYRIMVEGIKEAGKELFKTGLKEIDDVMADKSLGSSYPKWAALAASVIVLFGLSIAFLLLRKPSEPKLYAEHFQPWQNEYPIHTRGEVPAQFSEFTSDQFEELKVGADHYDAHEYKEAISVFKDLEQTQEDNEHLQFLLGLSYLNNNQPKKALPYFESLIDNKDFEYGLEVKWYYGMTLVYLGEDEKAQKVMDEVAYSDSPFSGQAKEILEELLN
ncbi:MAG: hypothetical protein JXB49_29230 [Bacteroidales bacterium]|nr:hypothetical protein [Bacteroidales bacterium]